MLIVSYSHFLKYWQLGARWLFATQNDAAHFCNEDVTDLIHSWLDAILHSRASERSAAGVDKSEGYNRYFHRRPTGSGYRGHPPLVEARDLKVERPSNASPKDAVPARLDANPRSCAQLATIHRICPTIMGSRSHDALKAVNRYSEVTDW